MATLTDRRTYMQTLRREQREQGLRRVSATLSAEEYARLTVSAVAFNERPTAHLKHIAMAHLDNRVLVPPELVERLDSLLAVVRGIGNNLNQMARHSNEMRAFLDTGDVRSELQRLDTTVRTFIEDALRPSGG
jgi:Bacterial mobilisation protein (MobC)